MKDEFLCLKLPLEKRQGYCFDGTHNMSGRLAGVQAYLKEICPGSLFMHCCNHSLDLPLQELMREVCLVAFGSLVVRESAKCKNI